MFRRKMALIGAGMAALFALSTAAFAQQPGQRGQGPRGQGRGQRGVSLAAIPVDVLDKLVKLTADQKAKITQIREKFEADTKGLRPQVQPGQPGQPGQRGQVDPETRRKLSEARTAANQQIQALLTQEQKDKLQSLQPLAGAGVPVALIADLKFTDDQRKKVEEISRESREKLRGLPQEERRAKGREIQQETRAKIGALLTADQKAQIEKYLKEHPEEARGQNRNRPRP